MSIIVEHRQFARPVHVGLAAHVQAPVGKYSRSVQRFRGFPGPGRRTGMLPCFGIHFDQAADIGFDGVSTPSAAISTATAANIAAGLRWTLFSVI